MSRILILYASHFGQTRAIARTIADRLREQGHEVMLADTRDSPVPTPERFDAVVLGSRVELGRHAADVRNYMIHHRDALEHRPTAFFSVSMSAARADAGADPDNYLATLFEDVGWKPALRVAFAGALPYRQYGWLMRFIMKRISRSAGHTTDTSRNHEFTSWPAVRAFADAIAAALPDHTARSSL
jgi:menaquinone-dependent protoporphyrinogen oxidase